MSPIKYRRLPDDVGRDLQVLIENCLFASEKEKGEINERYAASRLEKMLEEEYPVLLSHIMKGLLYDVLYDTIKEHIDRTRDEFYLDASVAGQLPTKDREILLADTRQRRYMRIKNPGGAPGFTAKRTRQLTSDDWVQLMKQRYQKGKEVIRVGDYAKAMVNLAEMLGITGAVADEVMAIEAQEGQA